MATWKDNATVLVLNELYKKIKEPELRKILVDARKKFVNVRAKQEKQFSGFYVTLFYGLLAYLNNTKNLTGKNFIELNKLVDSLFTQLVASEVLAIKNNVLLSTKIGADVARSYFKEAVKKSGILEARNIIDKLDTIILNETDKTFDLVFEYQWGKKKATLSKRIWNNNKRSRSAIKKIVQYYQDNNINDPRLLAKDLEGYLRQSTPVSKKLRKLISGIPKNVSYESLRLARSEINQGFTQSLYNSSRDTYGYQGIYWVLSSRHPEFDICTIYANTKKYGKRGFFPAGKEPRVPHPNCLCIQIAVYDFDKIVEDLKGWEKSPKKYSKIDSYIKTLNRKAGQIK